MTPPEIDPASPEPPREPEVSALRWFARQVIHVPGEVLILCVRFYQLFIGPLLGKHCRFHPSCSNYYIQAVRKYGAIVGSWKGICRIGRCHPWHPGGYDPP